MMPVRAALFDRDGVLSRFDLEAADRRALSDDWVRQIVCSLSAAPQLASGIR